MGGGFPHPHGETPFGWKILTPAAAGFKSNIAFYEVWYCCSELSHFKIKHPDLDYNECKDKFIPVGRRHLKVAYGGVPYKGELDATKILHVDKRPDMGRAVEVCSLNVVPYAYVSINLKGW